MKAQNYFKGDSAFWDAISGISWCFFGWKGFANCWIHSLSMVFMHLLIHEQVWSLKGDQIVDDLTEKLSVSWHPQSTRSPSKALRTKSLQVFCESPITHKRSGFQSFIPHFVFGVSTASCETDFLPKCEWGQEENTKFSVFHVQPVNALLKLFSLSLETWRSELFIVHSHTCCLATVAFNESSETIVSNNCFVQRVYMKHVIRR